MRHLDWSETRIESAAFYTKGKKKLYTICPINLKEAKINLIYWSEFKGYQHA